MAVKSRNQIVRLVHRAIEEYLRRRLHNYRMPKAHQNFAGALIINLSFTAFNSFSRDSLVRGLLNKAAQDGRVEAPRWGRYDEEDAYRTNFLESKILTPSAAENRVHHGPTYDTHRYCIWSRYLSRNYRQRDGQYVGAQANRIGLSCQKLTSH